MNPVSPYVPRWARLWPALARVSLWLATGVWLLLILSWGVLHGVIVPRIGEWRPQVESAATRALGIPVTIGTLRAESNSTVPTVELLDVVLHDASGREALRLPRITTALSVRSLWHLSVEQLVIEAPELDIRRTAQGRLTVAGIDVTAQPNRPSSAADWLFAQSELAILHGVLRWTDESRPQVAPLELQDVNLVLRNPGRQHLMRLDATPPPEWGQRFSLRAQLRQPLLQTGHGKWQTWSGTLFAEFDQLNLSHLRQYFDSMATLDVEVREGQGALRLWADVQKGRVAGLTTDLALNQMAVRLARDRTPLALQDLTGRIDLKLEQQSLDVSTHDLAFRNPDGSVWPGGNVHYGQTLDTNGTPTAISVQGNKLDLAALHQLSQHLPLPASAGEWLDRLQPQGLVEAVDLQWNAGKAGAAPRWQAKLRASGVALQAEEQTGGYGRPGLRGATLSLTADQSGGQGQLQLASGQLVFPGVFEESALDFTQLSTDLKWKVNGEQIEVQIPQLRFANADTQGQAQGSWHTSDPATSSSHRRFPGVLDLSATLDRADGARVYRYLPQDVPASVRHYLHESIQRAQARAVQFKVRGDLWDFPFDRAATRGEFTVRAKLADVHYAYVPAYLIKNNEPAWPALDKVEGDLSIDRASLHIANGRAQLAGAPGLVASQVDARINDFMRDPVVTVQGKINGPASDALGFINRSPLLDLTAQALQQAHISGNTSAQLQLRLPLDHLDNTTVTGQVQFSGNDVQITPDTPTLAAASGQLRFSEKGFTLTQGKARLLGGDASFQGGMTHAGNDTVIQFKGQGTASAEGLRQAKELGELTQVGRWTTGSTPYQAQLEFRGPASSILVTSSLQGLAVNLPAPLGKTAAASLPLRYEVKPLPGATSGSVRDQMALDIGPTSAPVVSVRYERESSGGSTRVLRGVMALGAERPSLPAKGVLARIEMPSIDAGEWEKLTPTTPTVPPSAAPTTLIAQAKPAGTDTRLYWPTSFSLRTRELRQGGRSFHDLKVDGSREADLWRGNIDARELKGTVEYRPAADDSPGRIQARLDRLSLPPAAANDVDNLLQQSTAQIPALDITVQEFELGARKLGKLEIDAVNRQPAGPLRDATREWRLNKLNLTVPEARLQASGNWAPVGAQSLSTGSATPLRRTALKLDLDIADSGALLARFGMPDVIKGGKGKLEGTVSWLGAPTELHYPSLGGELNLAVERGQFLKADPGLAKLLGVLSLQSLPRRLTLDFRDVFSEGFAFDFVRGNAKIDQGVVTTHNLQMKGVTAAVLLDGSADLARETQDIKVLVIPEISAGTASLLAAFVNPVTGLGTFIAQYLLGKPLQAAATQQFHISGSWSDPKVEKIDHPAANVEGNK